MPRFFNTTGPCDPARHFMVAPERRMPDLLPYIEREQYFVVHAARQVGKTTAMRALAERLRERGVVAVWATLEASQGIDDIERAEPIWMTAIAWAAAREVPPEMRPPDPAPYLSHPVGTRLTAFLGDWAASVAAPLVVLLDEADVLRGPALISLLRQLRGGFMSRGVGRFPTSVGLIGMRDLRDYLTESKDGVPVNPGSPFNIKVGSFTIRNFDGSETIELLAQHTAETGQPFEDDAADQIFRVTQGQPFLVNALADDCVTHLVPDRSQPVTLAHVEQARERLILARTTHLDALAQRLREPRVARIVEAVLLGDEPRSIPVGTDDFQYVVDLGLIRLGAQGAEAANPIYREILAREISVALQTSLPRPWWPWSTPDGRLDFPALIDAFRQWWRENEGPLRHEADSYVEAVPHIALMAFLQRVVNGGGRVHREFAAGRGAMDLVVEYAGERFAVEIKRVRERDGLDRQKERGAAQLAAYLDTVGLSDGWLILFDVRPGRSWEDRLWSDEVTVDGKRIRRVGA